MLKWDLGCCPDVKEGALSSPTSHLRLHRYIGGGGGGGGGSSGGFQNPFKIMSKIQDARPYS